ncbi:MAG: Lrp/AsnC family transcriptional regulator [Candidatus Nitrosotenuis sp.]
MEISYILIQCDMGYETQIINKLMAIPQVKEVRGTYGVFDIFVKIQADSKDEIDDIVTNKIRKLPNIRGTNTLIAILIQGGK